MSKRMNHYRKFINSFNRDVRWKLMVVKGMKFSYNSERQRYTFYRNIEKVWTKDGIYLCTKHYFLSGCSIGLSRGAIWERWNGRVRTLASGHSSRTLKIRLLDMVREEELRRRTGQHSVIEKMRMNRWRCFGHVLGASVQRVIIQANCLV